MTEWLQHWYSEQCNGDWEHVYGIKIETLDNPGWMITIGLSCTALEGLDVPYTLQEDTPEIWRGYSVTNNIFKGVGGPNELSNLIALFKDLYLSKSADW